MICARRSGEALSRNQPRPSAETASEACVRGFARGSPRRAIRHAGAFEFHWGKPPPAAEPRTTMRIAVTLRAGGAAAYFRLAQAYELISRPTAISMIFGFFHMVSSEVHHNDSKLWPSSSRSQFGEFLRVFTRSLLEGDY